MSNEAFDVVSVGFDIAVVKQDPSFWNVAALVVDAAAVIVPIVPSGAGWLAHGGRAAAGAIGHADEVADVARAASQIAGGVPGVRWNAIGEIFDPSIVTQAGSLDCGAACGAMLLQDRGAKVLQDALKESVVSGYGTFAGDLAATLNGIDKTRTWSRGPVAIAGASSSDVIRTLMGTGSWAAVVKNSGAKIGHWVVVDGFDDVGNILIRDPGDATRYGMT